MTPVTMRGRSHGTITSERARVRPGNRMLNSSASAKPIRNWPASEPTVNQNVLAIAFRLVGSLRMKW